MPNPIELALSSLLPTVSYLPPELISLSTSLLAQSRAKASSLKSEEEIGRTYACCHIACQRLGHRLALEIGKPAPPVKPKVYEKLHTYFNAVLKTTTTPRTPNGRNVEDRPQDRSAARRVTNSQATPSKKAAAPTPPSRKRTVAVTAAQQNTPGIPEFAKPIIRLACKSSNEPDTIPHVFAGVSSILHHLNYNSTTPGPRKRRKKDFDSAPESITEEQLPNLIIGVLVAVYSSVRGEEHVDERQIVTAAALALKRYQTDDPDAEFVYEKEEEMVQEIEMFTRAVKEAWCEMEWFLNVPTPETMRDEAVVGDEVEDQRMEEEGVVVAKRPAKTPLRRKEKHGKTEEDDDAGAAGLLPGLGTMFQPAVDWLSDDRQEDFVRWKRDVLREAAVVT